MNSIKYIKHILLSMLILLCIMAFPMNGQAAGSFSASGPSSVDANATYTISFGSGTTGQYTYSISGGTLVNSPSWVEGGGSLTVKAGASGSVTVTIKASNATTSDYVIIPNGTSKSVTTKINAPKDDSSSGNTGNGSGDNTGNDSGNGSSGSIGSNSGSNSGGNSNNNSTTTKPEDTRSSDNTLKSLSIEDVTLSPVFSKGELAYTAEVWDMETITISASATDSKASVSGTGTKELSIGENTLDVVVTAENGSKKTYSITLTLYLNPTVFMDYNDVNLGVVKNLEGIEGLPNFDKCELEYGEELLDGWHNEALKIDILYMIDDHDVCSYYVYKDETITCELKTIVIQKNTYYILDTTSDEAREGLVSEPLTINDVTLNGWSFVSDSFGNYKLISLTDTNGTTAEYLYSMSEGAIILAPAFAPVTSDEYTATIHERNAGQVSNLDLTAKNEQLEHNLQLALIIASAIIVLLLIALICVIIKMKKLRKLAKSIHHSGPHHDLIFLNEE